MSEVKDGVVQLGDRQFTSSDQLGKLAEALAKAQGEIEGAKKDQANPFFHSKYADLASVWEACRAPLSKNGLAVIQLPGSNGQGLFVDTILTHASGEWISSRLFITPVKNDPQGIGSAITYARRYGLQAIVGIAPEDDDAEAAMGRQQRREEEAKTARNAPLETKPRKGKKTPPASPSDGATVSSGPQLTALAKRLSSDWISEEDFMAAAKYSKLIPDAAKSFHSMTEETATKFLDDYDSVAGILKAWKDSVV